MLKKIVAMIIIVSIFIILSCSEDTISPESPDIEIISPKEGFVWGNTVEVQVHVENTENLSKIKLFIDNEIDSTIIFEDYIYPFNFNWNTEVQRYGKYYIQARLYTTSGTSTNSEIIVITLSPCPVYEDDLQNFQGITETDSVGNLIGSIDSTDWYYDVDTLSKSISKDNPFLVELSYFYVEYYVEGNFVSINWGTETETDNLGWYVYRNTAEDFTTAEKVSELIEGHGTTTEPHDYIYEDTIEEAMPGDTLWYWLESIDFGGNTEQYGPSSVTIQIPEYYSASFGPAYPNPTSNKVIIPFTVEGLENNSFHVSILIIDKNGNLIDVICDGTYYSSNNTITWVASNYINKLYRCIFHQSDSLHWHGDILVE